MCEYLDYRVTKLKRVRIMNIHLDVPIGQWRNLSAEEIAEIHSMVSDSAKSID
jgi:23S rRNA pseudouridine2604 synthase